MAIKAPKSEIEANPTSVTILIRSPTVRRAKRRENKRLVRAKKRRR
jgi:hypothetical protein